MYKGVAKGDDKLEEFEKEHALKNDLEGNDKVCVYDGVELHINQKEILAFPLQQTRYPKLNVETFERELEKCVVNEKWQKLREMREKEERLANVEIVDCVDKDPAELEECSNIVYRLSDKVMDFRNLKATDMKGNKR